MKIDALNFYVTSICPSKVRNGLYTFLRESTIGMKKKCAHFMSSISKTQFVM